MSKCLIVTGGGRGIGAEVSRKAAKQGYSVCVNFHRDQASAQKLVRELEKEGANALAYQADVSQEEEVEALFQTVEKDLGTPEALVNNAGILDLQTRVDGMNAERIQRIFAVNVTGSFLCAREAVKRMSKKYGGTGGSIVNLSSGAAKYGSPGEYVDYAASKAAIDTLTIGLARGGCRRRDPGKCRPARIHRYRNPPVRGRTRSDGTGPPASSDEKGGAGRRGCGCYHVAAFR